MRKSYDLEDRTFCFAVEVRKLIKELTPTISNRADFHKLAKSSGSVGTNYLEANNALSKKDSLMRIRICLKEAKESNTGDAGGELTAPGDRWI